MDRTVHMLFWIDQKGNCYCAEHQSLDTLLKASKLLRDGGMARFVCSATEDSDMVGLPGSDVAKAEDYKWFKRRLDPETPLGRNTRRLPEEE